jgi:hypothetical protein
LIELTDEMREAINGALSDRVPITVSYVDDDGQPSLSLRGSVQVYGSDQLAIWVRNPSGGILSGITGNPKLALMYRNPTTRLAWQFHGRAERDDTEQARQTIYDNSPEGERNADPDRKGVALVIDIDRVIARGEVLMER